MAEAHSFTWHSTGQSLLESKLRAIAAAQSSVVMETFIFRDSDIGARFRDALTAAAQRGVRVRLLVDRVGSFQLGRDYSDCVVAGFGDREGCGDYRRVFLATPAAASPARTGGGAR